MMFVTSAPSDLTDEQWTALEPLLPNHTRRGGVAKHSKRTLIDGIRYRMDTGIRWKDLPERYGPWETVYGFLWRWQQNGTWLRLLAALPPELDPIITWDVDERAWWARQD